MHSYAALNLLAVLTGTGSCLRARMSSPLIHITGAESVLVEQLQLINAPGFHVKIDGSRHVEAVL